LALNRNARPKFNAAASVDLGVLAHEFQHAVNQSTFGFTREMPAPQSGAIDESLGDIFGEFIMLDTGAAQADCILGETWAQDGVRNLVNPHQSNAGPQPDYFGDEDPYYYADTIYAHLNSGIPSKAWSLATFGGRDVTKPDRGVHPSRALGWAKSEQMYLNMVLEHALPADPTFFNLAWSLDGAAIRTFGQNSSERIATLCAWYAVGVVSANELQEWVHMSPCECTVPATVDAGSCDGGYNREFACHVPGPPNRCGMQILPKGIYDPVTKQNLRQTEASNCVAMGGTVVDACAPGGGLYTCFLDYKPETSEWVEVCFYPPGCYATGSVPVDCLGSPACDGAASPPPQSGTCFTSVQPWPTMDSGIDASPDSGPARCN